MNSIKDTLPKSLRKLLYKIFKPIVKWYYSKGNKVHCVICKSEFTKFRSYGVDVRNNAFCPNCGSLERHRLLWRYLKERTKLFDSDISLNVLHFAPENFFYKMFDGPERFNYVPCDIEPEIYNYKGKTEVLKLDITKLELEDNRFDFILCNHVLEHIVDDHKAMKELWRVMKPGGFGIFQVPMEYNLENTYEDFSITSPEERLIAFKQNNHVRLYGLDYKDRLKKAGFEVVLDDFVKTFSDDEVFKYGFDNRELIYKCVKPE